MNYVDAINVLEPVAYWRLGEVPGETVAVDETGNYNGTYVNSPTLGVTGLLEADDDTAVTFDGVDSYITAPQALNNTLCSNLFSITVIAYKDATVSGRFLHTSNRASQDADENDDRVVLSIFSTNCAIGYMVAYSPDWTVLEDDRTYHITFVQTTINTLLIYVDDWLFDTISVTGCSVIAPDTVLIGAIRNPDFEQWSNATIDEVAIFDYALTQEQVTTLYRASKSYAFDVIIDHSKVKEDLYDFPVLINLDSASGLNAMDSRRVFTELAFSRSVNDTFTGTDGDPLDTELWESVDYLGDIPVTPDPSNASIQNNKFKWNLTFPDTTGGEDSSLSILAKFLLRGDFDFEIEFDSFVSSQYVLYFFKIEANGLGGTLIGKELASNDTTYNFRSRIDGQPDVTVAKSSLFGKFRMKRIGGTFTSYYKDGNDASWTELQTYSSGVTTDVTIIHRVFTGSNTAFTSSINFDNFTLNSGTVIWPAGSVPTTSAISTFYVNPEDPTTKRLPYYNTEVLAQDPVAYYRLGEANGDTVAVDEVGNYDGTYNNSPTLGVTSLLDNDNNTAVSFDGVSQGLTLPDALLSALGTQPTGSISFIAQFPVGGSCCVNLTNSTDLNSYIAITIRELESHFIFRNNTDTIGTEFFRVESTRSFTPNTKHYITFVQDDINGVLIYVNGMLLDTIMDFGTAGSRWINDIPSLDTLTVNLFTISSGSTYYEGTVDELSFFDANLTAEQVERLYKKSVDITTESGEQYYANAVKLMNPVAYWRLGDNAGTVAVDEMGLYNGEYIGSPTLNQTGLLTNDVDTAVTFNGVDQYVERVESDFRGSDYKGSVSALVNLTDITGNCVVFSSTDTASSNYGLWLYIHLSGTIRFYNKNVTDNYGEGSINVVDGFNHHIVLTTDGTTYKIYLDGVEDSVTALSGTNNGAWFSDIPNRDVVAIGISKRNVLDQHFDGTLDEVALFDRALSASEVKHLYDTSKSLNSQVTTVRCKTEIDRWDQVNQQAQLWIKVPYISKDVDTIINFSYDSANADNSSEIGYTGSTPAQAVWTEYDAVYHLSKDGADSTSNAFDGTLVNIDSSNIVDFGVGKGMLFNGTDEWIDIGLQPEFATTTTENITIESYAEASNNIEHMRILQNTGSTIATLGGFVTRLNSLNGSYVAFGSSSGNYVSEIIPDLYLVDIPLQYTNTFEQNTGYLVNYKDGTLFSDESDNVIVGDNTNIIITSTRNTTIGCLWDDAGTQSQFMNGRLKEVRFAKNLKSEGWVASNYDSTQDSLLTYVHADTFVIGVGFINGITKVNGTPTSCKVYIYDENMVQVDFLNSGADGTFESNLVTNAEKYYVLVVSNTGECPSVSGLLTATELPSV